MSSMESETMYLGVGERVSSEFFLDEENIEEPIVGGTFEPYKVEYFES